MRIYKKNTTYLAEPGSFFEGNVQIHGNFIVPQRTHFWGRLVVNGTLELGPESSIEGDVICKSAIIGRESQIKGPLRVDENATICDRAHLHSIEAGGDIILRPGVTVGDVRSDSTVLIFGKINSGTLVGRNVKILGD
ncbi:MAG: polymer-forming cytoskeletal protein [Methanocalculus sp.]|uniref:polymer-forming cytoskeletal protein n=1 Tax=Methanocalculus sp. TaxID=2004547 RepID=UPI00272622EB|nr:polymer-forming cytoskeletal protein [Methanocalculus sp.]MDO9538739.1 polymer-forming cytoskeletal protein [Methanocalculus sp.]